MFILFSSYFYFFQHWYQSMLLYHVFNDKIVFSIEILFFTSTKISVHEAYFHYYLMIQYELYYYLMI